MLECPWQTGTEQKVNTAAKCNHNVLAKGRRCDQWSSRTSVNELVPHKGCFSWALSEWVCENLLIHTPLFLRYLLHRFTLLKSTTRFTEVVLKVGGRPRWRLQTLCHFLKWQICHPISLSTLSILFYFFSTSRSSLPFFNELIFGILKRCTSPFQVNMTIKLEFFSES